MTRTADCPLPESARTGRAFITPCCTSGIRKFLVDGQLWLTGHVAGHGRSAPWRASIDDINDTGTLVAADGSERAVSWSADRER